VLFLINLKALRESLSKNLFLPEGRITIKRKKKMIREETTNGSIRAKRRSVIRVEIIE